MLNELVGSGWVSVEPPLDRDESSVIARYRGTPIKAGFTTDEGEEGGEYYSKFRSGRYDIELRLGLEESSLRVREADGYE